jgi:glycosyltransferase involved in cell wall biosynthesis
MSFLKEIDRLCALGSVSEAKALLEHLRSTDYPRKLLEELSRRVELINPATSSVPCSRAEGVNRTLLVYSANDRMTNYYRQEVLHRTLKLEPSEQVVYKSVDAVLDDDLIQSEMIFLSRGGLRLENVLALCKAKIRGAKIVIDFDDYVFDQQIIQKIRHYEDSPKNKEAMENHARRLSLLTEIADVITCSTYYLASVLEPRFQKKAHVIPNALRREVLDSSAKLVQKREARSTKHLRIGYFSGTASHNIDFAQISEVIFRLMTARSDIQFLVCGHLNAELFRQFGPRFIKLGIQPYDKMHEYLSTIDICIAPLEIDNHFVHGKSELKVFEAALYGIPTVASRSDSLAGVIAHGQNGYLCQSPSDWENALCALLDCPATRLRVGDAARRTIVPRFTESEVASQWWALVRGIRERTIRDRTICLSVPMVPSGKPAISLVTILYKKERELPFFLESLRRQSFAHEFEVIVVNDCSPDKSVEVLNEFIENFRYLPGSNPFLRFKLINMAANVGNCKARNVGISAAAADIICIIDADCLLNRDFLLAHYNAHASNSSDVVIGPKGIETQARHPLSVLQEVEISRGFVRQNATPQDPYNQASYINTVTRNLSLRYSAVKRMLGEDDIFDIDFSYSASADSGFGWEDIELGARLYKYGAKFVFTEDAVTLHISHDTVENSADKGFRSFKNFERLVRKHSFIPSDNVLWFFKTADALSKWCSQTDSQRYEDTIRQSLESLYPPDHSPSTARTVLRATPSLRRMKILTHRWHCAHQYELFKLGCQFDLIQNFGGDFFSSWEFRKRPFPANARFIDSHALRASKYDLAIIHFDENVLRPDLCNGRVPLDWGAAFEYLGRHSIRKIFVCHGTPQFYGQYGTSCEPKKFGHIIEENRVQLVDFVGRALVVCNSRQAAAEWGFKNSVTIHHGFVGSEFSYRSRGDRATRGSTLKVLGPPAGALLSRPIYNGRDLFSATQDLLSGLDIEFVNLHPADPPVVWRPQRNLWAQYKYANYKDNLSRFDVYFNTTGRSPMPRTRTEAMFSGLVPVTTSNHDAASFIQNGVNGFLCDDPATASEAIKLLASDREVLAKMSANAYATARAYFSQERYLSQWAELILNA